jgi:nitroreductase
VLRRIFALACTAPSNCNTQPWLVEVVSGESRDRLSKALLEAATSEHHTPDFPFDVSLYTGAAGERRQAHGALYLDALGIARDDHDSRKRAILGNLTFFEAPHVALLFMPDYGGARIAADVGMYAQNLLTAMSAYGVASCCQTILGFYAQTVRETLHIDESRKLLFGISFGYADDLAPINTIRQPRAALDETTRFRV